MKAELRRRARALRAKRLSYNQIAKQLGTPKSTLHEWLHDLPPSPFQANPEFQRKHLERIRVLAAHARRAARQAWIEVIRKRVAKEASRLDNRNKSIIRACAALLYWAEGTKTERSAFKFANTDPMLALLFLTLIRKGFDIDEKKIRIALYLHPYHNPQKVRRFWSKLLSVPLAQFERDYLKQRAGGKRYRKNFVGICFIKYSQGAEALKQELLLFAKALQQRFIRPRSSVG